MGEGAQIRPDLAEPTHTMAQMTPVAYVLAAAMTIAGARAQSGAKADANELFGAHCASCHGLDGKARTPAGKKLGAKDLSESKLPDAEIVTRILEGLADKKGTSRMPAFRDHLSADEVAVLVGKVKAFRRG
jgi:mono/diheme cytochrome c family protein